MFNSSIVRAILALALLLAPPPTLAAGWLPLAAGSGGFTPSCTPSSNYLAALSGLSTTQQTNLDTLICGLNTDGNLASLDGLYIFAGTNSSANAVVNAANPGTYNGTVNGTLTYNNSNGFTGDGSSGYVATGFNPSTATSPQFTQNSGSIAGCVVNNRTTNAVSGQGGLFGSGNSRVTKFIPLSQFGSDFATVNYNGISYNSLYETTAQGHWLVTRTGSTASAFYYAQSSATASSIATDNTNASGAVDNVQFVALAVNDNPVDFFSVDTVAWIYWGAGFNSTQASQIYARFHTYATAISLGAC